jgi:hypothetical protein
MYTHNKKMIASKILVVIFFILIVYLGKKYAVPSKEVDCIYDPVHEFFH